MNCRRVTSILLVSALLVAPPLALAEVEPARVERQADRAFASEALQQRMEAIRAVLADAMNAHPDLRLTRAEGTALAQEVAKEIDALPAGEATDKRAGRQMSFLLGDMREGLDLMRTASHDDARRVGLMKVIGDLRLYGQLFEHPGWQGMPAVR